MAWNSKNYWFKKIDNSTNLRPPDILNYLRKVEKKPLIGYFPYSCSPKLIYSLGGFPVGISTLLGTNDKSEYFQSYMCSIFPELTEKIIKNDFSFLDGLIVCSICDIARNGYSILKESSRIKIHIVYYPIHLNDISKKYIKNEITKIKLFIKKLTKKRFSSEKHYRVNRTLISSLYDLRKKFPEKFLSQELYSLISLGRIYDVKEHNDLLRKYIKATLSKTALKKDNARIVLTGFFCEEPPLEFISAIEKSSCYIVDDDFFLDLRKDDPYLPTKLIGLSKERMRGMMDRIKKSNADGVVVLSAEFCDHALMISTEISSYLKSKGIPVILCRYSMNGSFSFLQKETLGTFSDSIRIWK